MISYTLRDLVEIKNGKDHKSRKPGSIPVYGSGGLMLYVDKPIYEKESVLLPRKGTLGNIQYVNHPFWTVDTIYYTEIDTEKVVPFHLYYYLKQLDLSKLNTGTGVPSMTFDSYYDIPIKLPSLSVQRKIAAVLSALDDKIELNRRINAELEQMARTLYDYWFVQFDFPDAQGKPYKSSGGSMKHSLELNRQIPDGWDVIKLQDVLEFEKGTEPGAAAYSETQNDEFNLPFYRVGDIDGETSTYINAGKFNAKIVQPHDVIVTFDGSVGKMGLGLDGAISGGLRHIYDKTGTISSAGVYAIFGNEYITKTIERYATGSIILHASSSIPYLMIPYDQRVFAKFQETIEPMFAKIIANRQQSQTLAHLRDWLLPMLMNGQVSVQGNVVGDT